MDSSIVMMKKGYWIETDEKGHLVLPLEVMEDYGIQPGAQMLLKKSSIGLLLQHPITQLAKVTIEPTSRCNLTCQTCIRNAWVEPQGDMAAESWNRVVENLKALPSRPSISRPAPGAAVAAGRRRTKRTALPILSLHAAAVCGRRESSRARRKQLHQRFNKNKGEVNHA